MIKVKESQLVLVTPFFILLAHYLVVFLHEYAHSFMAWLLGYKNNPLALNYGGTSLGNILLLLDIDQNVDNEVIYSLGYPSHVALIASAGLSVNWAFAIFSFWLLTKRKIKDNRYAFYFILFFNLMNLGNLYAYIPIRTFSIHGSMNDILDIEKSLNISPWFIYIAFIYLVASLIGYFFTKTLISAYVVLQLRSMIFQAGLMILCVCILFGYFGMPGLFNGGQIPYFLSVTSLLSIPGIIFVMWPGRFWVRQQVNF